MVSFLDDLSQVVTQFSSCDLEIELSLELILNKRVMITFVSFPFINRDNILNTYKVVKIKFVHVSSIDSKDINRIFKHMKSQIKGIFDTEKSLEPKWLQTSVIQFIKTQSIAM